MYLHLLLCSLYIKYILNQSRSFITPYLSNVTFVSQELSLDIDEARDLATASGGLAWQMAEDGRPSPPCPASISLFSLLLVCFSFKRQQLNCSKAPTREEASSCTPPGSGKTKFQRSSWFWFLSEKSVAKIQKPEKIDWKAQKIVFNSILKFQNSNAWNHSFE